MPRHPERAQKIYNKLIQTNKNISLFSKNNFSIDFSKKIILVDKIGYLENLFSLADIAFIGGSLIPHGGQNPIEPSHFNCALIFGPYMQNFQKISDNLLKNQAAIKTDSTSSIEKIIKDLMINPKKIEKLSRNLNNFCLKEKQEANAIWTELNIFFKNHLK